jgi:hypothetical protein
MYIIGKYLELTKYNDGFNVMVHSVDATAPFVYRFRSPRGYLLCKTSHIRICFGFHIAIFKLGFNVD